MQKLQFLLVFFTVNTIFYDILQAQTTQPIAQPTAYLSLEEGKPTQQNGIDLTYKILNFRKQEVGKKGMFDRYEVMVSASNNQGCDMMIWLTGNERNTNSSNYPLAEFRCLNATGARLTSKSQSLTLDARYVPYTTTTKGSDGKNIQNTIQVLAGYSLRAGSTKENRMIVIVPEGEKPQFEVRTFNYPNQ